MNSQTDTIAELPSVSIEKEMRRSYLDYAMSVIVSRALPDVRDGLKPVHRRILYAMMESNCDYNKPYRKSARIVGEVMGKYHPHGDSAIYDALVRMAQPFSMRVPLIDGQGNFGSMDGDNPAAMRYTESRLEKISHSLLEDIEKDTVDWQDNYDGAEKEPQVLPAQFPNILVNGAGGIAVGMATNIPPHNLSEVIDGTCMLIDNPETDIDELMQAIPAPDFPTGGLILGRSGAHSAMHTGRGSVLIRARTHMEEINGREAIVITEVPYQVNKARLQERIGELVRDKKIEGIAAMRDESDKQGVRVVIEVKRDAVPDVILNQLFKFTQLQVSFGSNMLAINRGRPELMNLKQILHAFIDFREEVITRRITYLLSKARERAHVLIGLSIAVANIDEVIAMIRSSKDPAEAKQKLTDKLWNASDVIPLLELVEDYRNKVTDGKCYFTETQVTAILDMKLQRLTGLEQEKIDGELNTLAEDIKDHLDTLSNRPKLMGILRDELVKIKEEFGTPRRSEIQDGEFEEDMEDLIQREDMVVTVTMQGYIKRVPLAAFRAQRRGGKGRAGLSMKDEDITTEVFVANTHTPMLFFSTAGKVYNLKVYKLPLGNPQSRGRALVNIFPLEEGETISQVMPMPEDEDSWDDLNIMFGTAKGNIRRNDLSDFKKIKANGKIAMKLDADDRLIGVKHCSEDQHILLAAESGKCIRCPVSSARVFKSRTSNGVRGMKLVKGDQVISMTVLNGLEVDTDTRDQYLKIPLEQRIKLAKSEIETVETDLPMEQVQQMADVEQFILTITENGYGKRSSSYEYRATNRGGSGIVNIVTSDRNGNVVASFPVEENDQVMLITDKGKLIRTPITDVRIAGRATQGVTLFKTAEGEKVVSAAHIADTGEEDEEVEEVEEVIESVEND